MKLFNRRAKKIDPNLPPEVVAFEQAEHRERVGMAWLVGIVSLIVSLAALALVYFGGVWIYQKLTGNDNKKETTTQTVKKETEPKKESPKKDDTDQPPIEDAPNDSSTSSDQTDTPVQAPRQTPKTGDDSEELVRTGPDIDL